ncbi:MAG TPA: amino acid adenylation domain-containing protein, partial [Anaerolineae bacterium]|nr:amino acid adenylation domain-containing protein [Anaerolineae bacterium]
RGLPPTEQETRLKTFLQAERLNGFKLSEPPLMRLALMRVDEDAYKFVWTHHHLLMDGWSLPILLQEVFAFYEAFRRGQELYLEPHRPYRDYIAWLKQQDLSQAEAFWRQVLRGFTAPTPLVVDRAPESVSDESPVAGDAGYGKLETLLSVETTAALGALARQHELTLNTMVQGAWALLLSRYSGEEDVVFGATVSGRPADLAGAESMVGLLINTLPVRARVSPEASLLAWLRELQTHQVELRQYEYSSLVQIQGWSDVPRGLPLFESILVFENYPVETSLQAQEGSLTIQDVHTAERTNYPLTVVAGPGEKLMLQIAYDCRRFDAATIQRMLGHFQTLLESIAADPGRRISSLPILTETERQQVLVGWNATTVGRPQDQCLPQLFEAQVERTPQAFAVTSEGRQLTYAELNRQANQLAHHLRKLGVGPETLVGICVERSPEMMVGLLSVLKAGGAYLPLDPLYPPERLTFMLEDAQVPVLLTQAHLVERLPISRNTHHVSRKIICLDADWATIAQESTENPTSAVTPDNLAYVIYTSGSTGVPKGVMVPHRALVNHALAMMETFGLKGDDRLLQFISPSFDASGEEFYPTLLSGATLVLPRNVAELAGADLVRFCAQKGITILHLPASVWHQCVDDLLANGLPVRAPLRMLLVGGESPAVDRLQSWAQLVEQPIRFLNAYGPTEATITTTLYETTCEMETVSTLTNVPIGYPIANAQVYLLDSHLQPVPVGVPGELYIGGAGVARGYLNRPKLTAERFIPDPFTSPSVPGARLYKTGDLARYLPDGNIEFLGRVDHQVKVRGFRIELGEIEAALGQHPELRESVVIVREDVPGDKRLVAYVVPKDAGSETEDEGPPSFVSELRGFLKEKLPDYMVPSAFVTLDALPLTPTGKVDRRALPAPDGLRPELEREYVAPRTPTEEKLVAICAELLGIHRVGVYDNFFDLGGHSLLATQFISRVRTAFGVEVPLRSLFEHPTIAELAQEIEETQDSGLELQAPVITRVPREARRMKRSVLLESGGGALSKREDAMDARRTR